MYHLPPLAGQTLDVQFVCGGICCTASTYFRPENLLRYFFVSFRCEFHRINDGVHHAGGYLILEFFTLLNKNCFTLPHIFFSACRIARLTLCRWSDVRTRHLVHGVHNLYLATILICWKIAYKVVGKRIDKHFQSINDKLANHSVWVWAMMCNIFFYSFLLRPFIYLWITTKNTFLMLLQFDYRCSKCFAIYRNSHWFASINFDYYARNLNVNMRVTKCPMSTEKEFDENNHDMQLRYIRSTTASRIIVLKSPLWRLYHNINIYKCDGIDMI